MSVITEDLPEIKLKKGDMGTVVFVHQNGEGYEVEFVTLGGETTAVTTLFAKQVRRMIQMSHKDRSHVKIDKTVISTAPLFDKSDLKRYWHSRSPQERLEYMEMLRRTNYGNKAAARLQRVFELVEKTWR